MSQYTRGPWQWFENDGAHHVDTVYGGKPIADLDSIVNGGRSEVEANAHLIAAGPTLYQSAVASIEAIKQGEPEMALIYLRHAIKQAEGGAK